MQKQPQSDGKSTVKVKKKKKVCKPTPDLAELALLARVKSMCFTL